MDANIINNLQGYEHPVTLAITLDNIDIIQGLDALERLLKRGIIKKTHISGYVLYSLSNTLTPA